MRWKLWVQYHSVRKLGYVQLYISTAHWAETDNGLSAGQHGVLAEGKGKGTSISLQMTAMTVHIPDGFLSGSSRMYSTENLLSHIVYLYQCCRLVSSHCWCL